MFYEKSHFYTGYLYTWETKSPVISSNHWMISKNMKFIVVKPMLTIMFMESMYILHNFIKLSE